MRPIALTVTSGEKDVSGRELLFNLMPVKSTGGKYPFKLVSVPGKQVFATLPTKALGLFKSKATGRAFAATASNLYELSADGTTTDRGAWTMSGRVSLAANGTHLVAVDGSVGWVLTLATNVLAQITDPEFLPCDKVEFLDGFFVFNRAGTGQYFISSLYGVDFDGLDFATAEGDPDNIATIISDHREIFLLGTDSTEAIYSSGGSDFPFARNGSAFSEKGCAAKYSVAKANNAVYFVGSDLIVYEMQGYTPQRVSNDAIEADLQDTPLDDCFGYTYHEQGHIFYVLTIPTRLKTWVFEALTRTWHQRSSYQSGAQGRDISNSVVFWQNKTLVSDWQNGNLYHLTRNFNAENTQPIVRRVRLPTITSNRGLFTLSCLEFDVKRGVGTATGDDTDPVAWLRYSRDGGNTWNTHPDQPSLGKIGEFYKRVRFNRLGRGREFDLELNISHSVDVEIGGAFIDGA